MRNLILLLALSGVAMAQDPATNPQLASVKSFYMLVRSNVLKSTDAMPEAKYSYRPVDSVRSFAELLMHIADAQYFFCTTVNGEPSTNRGIEASKLKTKAEMVKALNDGFAYCDAAYAKLTDATSAAKVTFLGEQQTKLALLSFNTAHVFEHYGNIVTYLRINGIVPPSTPTPPPAPAQKK